MVEYYVQFIRRIGWKYLIAISIKSTESNGIPTITFCTSKYLFGTATDGKYRATVGQFTALVN